MTRLSIDERLAAAGLPPLPRRLWAEIDEDALASNLRTVRGLLEPGVALNAVVKADAYGHGLVPVGRVLEAAGADRLCVASIDEATALRHTGYMFGGTSPFGTRHPLPLYAERSMFDLPSIYINGGKRGFLIEIDPADLRKALPVTEVDVAITEI